MKNTVGNGHRFGRKHYILLSPVASFPDILGDKLFLLDPFDNLRHARHDIKSMMVISFAFCVATPHLSKSLLAHSEAWFN